MYVAKKFGWPNEISYFRSAISVDNNAAEANQTWHCIWALNLTFVGKGSHYDGQDNLLGIY